MSFGVGNPRAPHSLYETLIATCILCTFIVSSTNAHSYIQYWCMPLCRREGGGMKWGWKERERERERERGRERKICACVRNARTVSVWSFDSLLKDMRMPQSTHTHIHIYVQCTLTSAGVNTMENNNTWNHTSPNYSLPLHSQSTRQGRGSGVRQWSTRKALLGIWHHTLSKLNACSVHAHVHVCMYIMPLGYCLKLY